MISTKKINLLFTLCYVLLSIRLVFNQDLSFLFLYWNLFLAWIPYVAIKQLYRYKSMSYQSAIFCFSLLFLPNAPYIVTDLFHIRKNLDAPIWFDLVLLLSFSMLGMIYFLLTMQEMLRFLSKRFKTPIQEQLAKFGIISLCSYGIYLGRFLRLNSWDIVSHPNYLATKMLDSFSGSELANTLQITLTFSAFFYVMYELFAVKPTDTSEVLVERKS